MNTLNLDGISTSTDPNDHEELNQIFEVKGNAISYEEFYVNFLKQNRPCLVKGVSSDWFAQKEWITENGKPNFDFLVSHYGFTEAPVSICNQRYYNSQKNTKMKLKDYITYWKKYIENGYPKDEECLYLKDWHFANEFKDKEVYRVPLYFASDWLNEYLLNCEDDSESDYRFIYMGPKGSWTPLHSDVFSSFSWSVNICGVKKWIFISPTEEHCLKDNLGNLAYNFDLKEELTDPQKYPNFERLTNSIELIQAAGDAIFVPSGWVHQVWNLDDTISINHNWFNACNVRLIWSALNATFSKVSQEISDIKDSDDFEDCCQVLLKSTFGMNHSEFLHLIEYICSTRIAHLESTGGSVFSIPGHWNLSSSHIKYDLRATQSILEESLSLQVYRAEKNKEIINKLLTQIKKVLLL